MALSFNKGFNWYATDNATFRTFGLGIVDLFTQAGMVKTSDTGQINWATAVKPTVAGIATSAGYEMWRFNDALQGTNPCFIKLQYGVERSVNNGTVYITLGTGTDGAGNLTNPVYCGPLSQTADDSGATSCWNAYSLGAGAYVGACFSVYGYTGINQTNGRGNGQRFFIDRTRDPLTGLPTGDGVFCHINDPANIGLRLSLLGYGGILNQSRAFSTQPFPASSGGSSWDRTAWYKNEFRPRPILLRASHGKWLLFTGFLFCTPTDFNHTWTPTVTVGSTPFLYQPCWETYNTAENVNEQNESVGYLFGNGLYGAVLIRE